MSGGDEVDIDSDMSGGDEVDDGKTGENNEDKLDNNILESNTEEKIDNNTITGGGGNLAEMENVKVIEVNDF